MTLRSICAETFRHQLTEENMRIFRMAFVSGFVGALMAGNVATLHAAPLPTNVTSMKSMVADNSIQVRWDGWRGGGWGYRGFGGGLVIEAGAGERARWLAP